MKRALALSLLAACSTSVESGKGAGTPDNPQPQQSNEGPYQVVTSIDFTAEAVLPPQAETVVSGLRDFSQNPAQTLINLATQAGVPAVSQLYGAIPSQLTSPLEGWINGEIEKVQIGGMPITTWAGNFASIADTAFTKFDVDSTLAIDGNQATHTLTFLDFTPTGVLNQKVPLAGVTADILTQTPTVDVGMAGAITLGSEQFGLLFGEYAWDAVNAECTTLYGADLRTTLGNAVNCTAVAQAVANKCVLTVCVGHANLIDQLCEGGLDALVAQIHQQFDQINLAALSYGTGTGTLVDVDGDGIADRIDNGTWDAQMDLGLGLRHTPATFIGLRADSNGNVIQ